MDGRGIRNVATSMQFNWKINATYPEIKYNEMIANTIPTICLIFNTSLKTKTPAPITNNSDNNLVTM